MTSPACDYYQCHVDWSYGETVAVNWLNPPEGNVSVSLASNIGGATYPITDSYPAISQHGYCDAGYGVGVVVPGIECGRIEFEVPGGWVSAVNYTIVVQSLEDGSSVGYTDNVNIVAAAAGVTAPSGKSVELLTVDGGVTSTNTNGATTFTGKVPADTAVTGQAAKTSSSANVVATTTSAAVKSTSSAASAAASAASVVSASPKSKSKSAPTTSQSKSLKTSTTTSQATTTQAQAAVAVAASSLSSSSGSVSKVTSSGTDASSASSSKAASSATTTKTKASKSATTSATSATTTASSTGNATTASSGASVMARSALALVAVAVGAVALL